MSQRTLLYYPTPNHWTVDWDVATIFEALEEISPELVDGDRDFRQNPSLTRLCDMVAALIHRWKKLTQQYHSRTGGLGVSSQNQWS